MDSKLKMTATTRIQHSIENLKVDESKNYVSLYRSFVKKAYIILAKVYKSETLFLASTMIHT